MKNNFIAPPPACGRRAVSKAKTFAAVTLGAVMAFSLIACADKSHTSHDWSTTYTPDGDRHYQTCSGCDEKLYNDHDYGTNGVCVCGKTNPDAHTSHDWSTTYTPDGDRHYQTCSGCDEKLYNDHDYGTSGTCVCGKTEPETSVAVTGVTLDKSEIELTIGGDGVKLTATVAPANATDKSITYSVEPTGVVSVDNDGNVTAIAEGEAVITATSANGKTATCNVTVSAPITNTQIIAALDEYCATIVYEECFIFDVEENNVSNENWYLTVNSNEQITKAEYSFICLRSQTSAYFTVATVEFASPLSKNDLIDGNIGNASCSSTSAYKFNYNPTIQETRNDLTNAICDKVFGENVGVTRYIVDNGYRGTDTQLGEVRQFTVVEILEDGVKEISINIKNSADDTEYISKLSDTSNYRTYDEKSYTISGTKVENNNFPFVAD